MEHPDQFSPSPTEAPEAAATSDRAADPAAPAPEEVVEAVEDATVPLGTGEARPMGDALPTMADLDRLSADLDQVDATLADLDRDVVAEPGL